MMGLVLANTALALTNVSVNQEPRFFRTVRIESDDHILGSNHQTDYPLAIAVSAFSSPYYLFALITCSIVSVGITVSIALSTSPDSIPCATNENFLSCI